VILKSKLVYYEATM